MSRVDIKHSQCGYEKEGGIGIMAHNIKNVSKSRPCPICGKTDWCGFMSAEDYGELVLCMRDTDQQNRIGFDGQFYVFVATSKKGKNSIFEEANQRMEKEKAWKGKSGEYKFDPAKVPQAKKMTVVDQVNPRSNKELDLIYRTMLSFLSLEPCHREYLKREGWSDELINNNMIVSFPEKDYTRFKYRKNDSKNPYRKALAKKVMDKLGLDNLRGVPGAYKDKNGNWTFAGQSGILFPEPDLDHLYYRLRIRMDFNDPNAEIHTEISLDDWYYDANENKIQSHDKWYYDTSGNKNFFSMKGVYKIEDHRQIYDKSRGKYRNFASYHTDEEEEKRGFIVNSYDQGCEAGNQLGFYYNEQKDDMYIAYVTEGEKKGIFSNDKLRAMVINIPGVNSWSLLFHGKKGERPIDKLKQKGIRIFVIAYDADKNVNKKVLEQEQNIVNAFREEECVLGTAEWDMNLGKGMDDYLAKDLKLSFVAV